MPELDLPAPYPDATLGPAAPQPPAFPRGQSPGRVAADVPERDVRAFDAAIAGPESGQSAMSASGASSKPGASGSLAEMTANLGIYRDALAAAESSPTGPAAPGLQPAATQVSSLHAASDAGLTAERALNASAVVSAVKPASTDGVEVKQSAASQVPSLHAASDAELKGERALNVNTVVPAVKPASRDGVEVKQSAASQVPILHAASDAELTGERALNVNTVVPAVKPASTDGIELKQPAAAQGPSLCAVSDAGLTGEPAAEVIAVVPAMKPASTDGIELKQPAAAQGPSLRAVSDAGLTGEPAAEVIAVVPAMKRASAGRVEVKQSEAARGPGFPAVTDAVETTVQVAAVSSPFPSAPTTAIDLTRDVPSASRFDVASIVQQVTRELGMRDLAALDAGREVVLRLDERILPQTVLTFQAQRADGENGGSGGEVQVLVGLQTQSDEVRAFLDSHGQSLVDAMAREAPGLLWVPGDLTPRISPAPQALLDTTPVLAGAASPDPAQLRAAVDATSTQGRGAFREHDTGSAEQSTHGYSGQQRGESQSDPGHGQRGRSADTGALAEDGPVAGVAAGWASLTEAERARSAQTFTDVFSSRS